jgi:hypothetical protein
VTSRDPITGELTAQPVLNVIVGHGDKHLIGVMTSRAPPSDGSTEVDSDGDWWVSTANHPIWVERAGWTDAEDLRVGDVTVGAGGQPRAVLKVRDYGWLKGQTVHNLSVANVHTFVVGEGDGVLVHNASSCAMGGVYALRDSAGTVVRSGRTNNLARRQAEHARDKDLGGYNFEVLYRSNNKKAVRGLEQMVHDQYKPRLNKINPISPKNPRRGAYMAAARAFLRR